MVDLCKVKVCSTARQRVPKFMISSSRHTPSSSSHHTTLFTGTQTNRYTPAKISRFSTHVGEFSLLLLPTLSILNMLWTNPFGISFHILQNLKFAFAWILSAQLLVVKNLPALNAGSRNSDEKFQCRLTRVSIFSRFKLVLHNSAFFVFCTIGEKIFCCLNISPSFSVEQCNSKFCLGLFKHHLHPHPHHLHHHQDHDIH